MSKRLTKEEREELEAFRLSEKFDKRYTMKWVEKAIVWGIYTVAGVIILALMGLIIIKP